MANEGRNASPPLPPFPPNPQEKEKEKLRHHAEDKILYKCISIYIFILETKIHDFQGALQHT